MKIIQLSGLKNPTQWDLDAIENLKTYLGGGQKGTARRNTLMSIIASRIDTPNGEYFFRFKI